MMFPSKSVPPLGSSCWGSPSPCWALSLLPGLVVPLLVIYSFGLSLCHPWNAITSGRKHLWTVHSDARIPFMLSHVVFFNCSWVIERNNEEKLLQMQALEPDCLDDYYYPLLPGANVVQLFNASVPQFPYLLTAYNITLYYRLVKTKWKMLNTVPWT